MWNELGRQAGAGINSAIKTRVNSPSEAGALYRARGWADGPRLTPLPDVRLPGEPQLCTAGGSWGGKGQPGLTSGTPGMRELSPVLWRG